MTKSLIVLLIFLFFIVSLGIGQEVSKTGFKISSAAYENNGRIPSTYACDGANINPPLKVENTPKEAKSLALVFDDIDAPRGSYVHWILWNMDPNVKEIKENSVPEGAIQGTNDFKKQNYGGPCPPGRGHKYVFKIYALDTRLDLSPSSTKTDLEKAMKGHILAQSQWIGTYKKKGGSPPKK
ncbi:MAG: YbhB/YbcL family Raf kinase inhibitor-like protein [Deltaproteobacteria bacterium]|nr:YbhB/YbcL family Raf kinase inhibitor-like protein [Deltaproteobacteria bacterium]MBM4322580.1 YbhB/YbcL family Raf kinase inhibitor-like protein [Deltaproteobacteria bacterium]